MAKKKLGQQTKLLPFWVIIRDKITGRTFNYYTEAENILNAKLNAKEEKGETHDILSAVLR